MLVPAATCTAPSTLPHHVKSKPDPPLHRPPIYQVFTSTVTLLVGPSAIAIHAYEPPLIRSSTFFRAALSPTYAFAESRAKTIRLPEDRPEDVTYFLRWLYTRSLRHPKLDDLHTSTPSLSSSPSSKDSTRQKPAFGVLLRLWIFADKYGIRPLRNDIVDKVIAVAERENACPNPDDTWTLYEEVSDGGGAAGATTIIRDVVLDLFTFMRTERLLEEHEDAWHERFLRGLAVRTKRALREGWGAAAGGAGEVEKEGDGEGKGGGLAEGKGNGRRVMAPWKLDKCCYHEHVEGEECFSGREEARPMSEMWL